MINTIIIITITVYLMVLLGICTWIGYNYLNEKNRIRELETKNEKYNLFTNISPEAVNNSINEYINTYIHKYITFKFIINKQIYIKDEECSAMVRDITKLIYIEISELYVFYIKIITNIETDDDLLKFLNTRVKELCIEAISDFNSSR